jgi:hypothetical protein
MSDAQQGACTRLPPACAALTLPAAGEAWRYAEVRISATGERFRIFHTLRDTTILRGYRLSLGNNSRLIPRPESDFAAVSIYGRSGQVDGVCAAAAPSSRGMLSDFTGCAIPEPRVLFTSAKDTLGRGSPDHRVKASKPRHRQAPHFTARRECSWVLNSAWLRDQRLELETDLIGAHVMSMGHAPIAQFLG